ncbi:leucine-rich repeat domain-containing protein [Lacipirellula parvula]|uniref:Leucine Rich repeats (2 copies) n=1 Tax=Lacipirellula parvula TaxID=2650471 RepID=A0A5K7XD70_9BACT|nr:hypothetical protein [Lacipirellula parvula]BBO33957.1 hypothetical protein PLANPX_3569 [Lacipirellula parvula]
MTRPPKRWLKVSLRSLLLAITAVSVALAWYSHGARQRRAAVAAIEAAGGKVRMAPGSSSWVDDWFASDLRGSVVSVDLRNASAADELIAHIAVLSELHELDLSSAAIDDDDLKKIAHLPLGRLWLQSTRITDASAPTLSQMKNLDFLQLNATGLTDAFLHDLAALPHLQKLGLRGAKVTDQGLEFLSRHPHLEELDLYDTAVTDAGVETLINCQQLKDLGISMTKVTSDVFQYLAQMPHLTDVDLSANDVTTEEVLNFERANPKCDVEWYGP